MHCVDAGSSREELAARGAVCLYRSQMRARVAASHRPVRQRRNAEAGFREPTRISKADACEVARCSNKARM